MLILGTAPSSSFEKAIMVQKKGMKHWTYGCTERINRLRDQYFIVKPSIDIERAISYTKSFKETEARPTIVRRAKALRRVIEEKKIVILPDELIVGTQGSHPRAAEIYPDVSRWIKSELDTVATRPHDPYLITEEQKRILREEILPYWEGKSMEDYFVAILDEEIKEVVYKTGILFSDSKSMYGSGEINPGYGNIILKKGFSGIKETAEQKLQELDDTDVSNFDKRIFLEAVVICCEAMQLLGQRYADKAREMAQAEKELRRNEELLKIAEICERVPWNPPRTFWEALQAVQLTQTMLYSEEGGSVICPGRVDQYLYPFYLKDIKEGRLTEEEAQELIECFFIKLSEVIFTIDADSATYFNGYTSYSALTVGGVTREGRDATNELSYMILQAEMNLRLYQPTINVRIHPQSPDAFLRKVCDLISLGTGHPAVFFDPTAIRILLRLGMELEDAYDWCIGGCVEPSVPGKTSRWAEGNRYSYATAVEWALYDGVSHVLRKKVGLSTGDPISFTTYEEFKDAVKKQLAYLIRYAVRDAQTVEKAHWERLPKPLMSCCVEGCVENGIELMRGGARYNWGPGFETTGIADLADSMAAVKTLVYEEKLLTMKQLITALEKNFEGYEDIRQMLINKAPKYGNDIDEVDYIAAEMLDFAVQETEKYKGIKGTTFRDGLVPVIANVPHGKAIWALPSGRKATEPLADGISPYMGYDHKGPTAVIKSICKINHDNHFATLLNLKFSPDLLKDEKGKRNLINLLRTEMELGGYHAQFNVVSGETLCDAQRNPEKYPNLLVRVAGYSALFNDLSKEMQDVIIARTEHMAW